MSSTNVHVKLQYESEYRRFFIERKSSFLDLLEKVKTILGLNSDLVIKYKDEENEWITISSDLELETGIILSSSIFRLQACIVNLETSCPISNPLNCPEKENNWKGKKWEKKI